MIKDHEAYRRLSEDERWAALERMTPEESLAIMEALLTSEIMDVAEFSHDDQHLSLAISLGIERRGARQAT